MKYDPNFDLEYRSGQLASFLYILGFSDDQLKSITIDDAINTIRNKYIYSHDMKNTSSQEYIKKQNITLTRAIRRAWFDVQVARFIKDE
jgi:hypothetical protein